MIIEHVKSLRPYTKPENYNIDYNPFTKIYFKRQNRFFPLSITAHNLYGSKYQKLVCKWPFILDKWI